jgi:hypothetical protein
MTEIVVVIGPNANQVFGLYSNKETAYHEISEYLGRLEAEKINTKEYNFVITEEVVLG